MKHQTRIVRATNAINVVNRKMHFDFLITKNDGESARTPDGNDAWPRECP